ncbi:MAG TPA: AI-2E family transporter [Gemmatimonadaceae bacterium]|jgi:predicted PurR-regulated permease PerM
MSDPQGDPGKPDKAARRASRRHLRRDGWRNADVLRATALVIGVYVLGRVFWMANPLFFTAFLGTLFGLAVASGVDKLVRFKLPRGIAAALIVLCFFGLLFGFGAWMAPTIRAQATELRHRLPDALGRAESWARQHQNGAIGMVVGGILDGGTSAVAPHDTARGATDTARAIRPDSTRPDSARPAAVAAVAAVAAAPASDTAHANQTSKAAADSATLASTLRDKLGARVGGAKRFLFPFLTSTIEVLGGILIIVFLSIYIAADPDLYHDGIMKMFPRPRRKRAGEVLSAIAAVLRRWLITQLIAMATIGTVTTVVLLVFRVKAAFALGLLAGLFEFIPTVGPILSAVPAVAMGFLDSPEKAMFIAIAFFMIQFMENHLLIPLLMKGGVNVPPALTILSQALMALLFGFLGLMCAVPILAATLVAVKMLYVENVVGERALGADENPARGVA